MHIYNTTDAVKRQLPLIKKLSGKIEYNRATQSYLAPHLSADALANFTNCGGYLTMLEDESREKKRLETGFFCKQKFCSGCMWRKAVKDAVRISTICTAATERHKLDMIFVTLTVTNVTGDKLRATMKHINNAWNKLMRTKAYTCWENNIRKMEVTYNREEDTYHPHLHIIVLVDTTYFRGGSYISHNKLLTDWRNATNMQEITQVNVKRCTRTLENRNAILEVSKYVAKASDFAVSKEVFDVFYTSLYRMNMLTFAGLCKTLNAEYEADGLSAYLQRDETQYMYRVVYCWCATIAGYDEIEVKKIESELESLHINLDNDID